MAWSPAVIGSRSTQVHTGAGPDAAAPAKTWKSRHAIAATGSCTVWCSRFTEEASGQWMHVARPRRTVRCSKADGHVRPPDLFLNCPQCQLLKPPTLSAPQMRPRICLCSMSSQLELALCKVCRLPEVAFPRSHEAPRNVTPNNPFIQALRRSSSGCSGTYWCLFSISAFFIHASSNSTAMIDFAACRISSSPSWHVS